MQPPLATPVGARSPSGVGLWYNFPAWAPVAQRIEHLTSDQAVGGSNPSRRASKGCPWESFQAHRALTLAGLGPARGDGRYHVLTRPPASTTLPQR